MKKLIKLSFLPASILTIWLVLSCETNTAPKVDIVFPTKDVSYTKHVQPMLYTRCAVVGCHDDDTRSGAVSFSNYVETTKPGVVDKSSPATSRLIWRINGSSARPMPPTGIFINPLNKNQVDGIYTWIKEGSPNN